MARIHETLSGHRIEYPDPSPKLEKFLLLVLDEVEKVSVSEDELVSLIYGRENPILDHTIFPERGAVTKEVLENPVYAVLTDLLARKHAAIKGLTAEQLGKRYTLTVAAAAESAGVTQDAIRKAIKARRLPSWVRDGQYYLDPKTLAAVDFGSRRPSAPIHYRCGYNPDLKAFFRCKAVSGELSNEGEIENVGVLRKWRKVAVLSGGFGGARYFEIEPAETEDKVEFNHYFIQGKFRVVRKENSSKAAREAFEEFVPS